MARDHSPAARSAPRRQARPYSPPTPLEDIHILDLLELAGSQVPGARVCRYGHNSCLEHLRLAYREHRLMEGLLRIGSDVLHQSLLLALPGVQRVPPRFRSLGHWLELLRHGLLDGVILSSFCLRTPLRAEQPLGAWEDMAVLPLAPLALQLVSRAADTRSVLLPARAALPLLHQLIAAHGFAVEQQPAACQEQHAWLKRARDRQLALPICPLLVGADWLTKHRLVPLPQQPALVEPRGNACGGCVLSSPAPQSMQKLHEIPVLGCVSEPAEWRHGAADGLTLELQASL